MEDNRTLFVANLGPEVTEALLRELFLQAGPIEKVRLTVINGVPKPFAHIIYLHECSVTYAANIFKGTKLFQRDIVVKQNNDGRDSGQGHFNPREDRNNYSPRGNQYTPYRDERPSHHREGRNNYPNQYQEERNERPRGHYRNDRNDQPHGNHYRDERSHGRQHHRDERNNRSSHGYHQHKHNY